MLLLQLRSDFWPGRGLKKVYSHTLLSPVKTKPQECKLTFDLSPKCIEIAVLLKESRNLLSELGFVPSLPGSWSNDGRLNFNPATGCASIFSCEAIRPTEAVRGSCAASLWSHMACAIMASAKAVKLLGHALNVTKETCTMPVPERKNSRRVLM